MVNVHLKACCSMAWPKLLGGSVKIFNPSVTKGSLCDSRHTRQIRFHVITCTSWLISQLYLSSSFSWLLCYCVAPSACIHIRQLPIGPATAHGMGIMTELYVKYMERYASHPAMAVDSPHWQLASWHIYGLQSEGDNVLSSVHPSVCLCACLIELSCLVV